ncbi:MAG: ATP-dependent Clp protease adaptor ClpS [Caldilineaceae bacterium]
MSTIDGLRTKQLQAPTAVQMEIQVLDAPERVLDDANEPRWRVLIYNDEHTPRNYVIYVLEHIFLLSDEIAEHVVETAESEGVAVVVVRPKPEAERLISVAHARAKLDGHPLTFTLEQD